MHYTSELYALWCLASDAATASRRIFGQLWLPDPTFNDIIRFTFADGIADALNNNFPLKEFFS